jgi:hypothetical protein
VLSALRVPSDWLSLCGLDSEGECCTVLYCTVRYWSAECDPAQASQAGSDDIGSIQTSTANLSLYTGRVGVPDLATGPASQLQLLVRYCVLCKNAHFWPSARYWSYDLSQFSNTDIAQQLECHVVSHMPHITARRPCGYHCWHVLPLV